MYAGGPDMRAAVARVVAVLDFGVADVRVARRRLAVNGSRRIMLSCLVCTHRQGGTLVLGQGNDDVVPAVNL